MTQYIDFQPTIDAPFQFSAVFDGGQYQISIPYGMFGQRYYLRCDAVDGTNVFYKALVESQIWRRATLTTWAENPLATIDDPSYIGPGTIILSPNVAPGTFVRYRKNGALALSIPAIASGIDPVAMFDNDVNLLSGYFTTSTLVYRVAAAQFEIGTYPPVIMLSQQVATPTFVPAVPPPNAVLPVTSPFPPSTPPTRIPNPFVLGRSKLNAPDVLSR